MTAAPDWSACARSRGEFVALVGELNDEFDIEIKPSDLVPANFNSAKAINALVEKLMDE